MIQCHLCHGLYDDFTVHSQVCPRKGSLSHSPISVRSPRDFDSANGLGISSPDEVHDHMFHGVQASPATPTCPQASTPPRRQSQLELVRHLHSVSARASRVKAELNEGIKIIAVAERSKMQAEYDLLIDERRRLWAIIEDRTSRVQDEMNEMCNQFKGTVLLSSPRGGLKSCGKDTETTSFDHRIWDAELEMQSRLRLQCAELEIRSERQAELERKAASQSQALEAELEMQSQLRERCAELEMQSFRHAELERTLASQSHALETHTESQANLESELSEQKAALESRKAMQSSLEGKVAQQAEVIDAQSAKEVQLQAKLADLEAQATLQVVKETEVHDTQYTIESELRSKISDLEARLAYQSVAMQVESDTQAKMREQFARIEEEAANRMHLAESSSLARMKSQTEEAELYAAKQMQLVESSVQAKMKEQIKNFELQVTRAIQSAEFAESSAQTKIVEQAEEIEMRAARLMELERELAAQQPVLDAQKTLEAGLVAELSKLIETHSMKENQLNSKLADLESRFAEQRAAMQAAPNSMQNLQARSELEELQRHRQWLHQENDELKRELTRAKSSEVARDELITKLRAREQLIRRVEITQSEDLSNLAVVQEQAMEDMLHYRKAEMQREEECHDLRRALQEECNQVKLSNRGMPVARLPSGSTSSVGQTQMDMEDEIETYSQFSKLYIFVGNSWEERGTGETKLLKNKKTGQVRFMFRQEKTQKVLGNHLVVDVHPYCDLLPSADGASCWVWTAQDFADNVMNVETLALKFGTFEKANAFKEAFENAKQVANKATEAHLSNGAMSSIHGWSSSVGYCSKFNFDSQQQYTQVAQRSEVHVSWMQQETHP